MIDNRDALVALAEQIAPGLVEEYGHHPGAQTRADYIARWLDERGIDLDDTDFKALMGEVKDLAPTYTLTAS